MALRATKLHENQWWQALSPMPLSFPATGHWWGRTPVLRPASTPAFAWQVVDRSRRTWTSAAALESCPTGPGPLSPKTKRHWALSLRRPLRPPLCRVSMRPLAAISATHCRSGAESPAQPERLPHRSRDASSSTRDEKCGLVSRNRTLVGQDLSPAAGVHAGFHAAGR